MTAYLPILLSALALLISCFTAWFTLMRRGKLKITQPTVIFLGPDGVKEADRKSAPKVFLRTLLFSTGKRGNMIESMYVKVTKNETIQNFNVWVYGDKDLVRGSGLFVGETGVATNHHFLSPKDGSYMKFNSGVYKIDLFAKILGENTEQKLWTETLSIDSSFSREVEENSLGVYFDWGSDSKFYIPHVERKRERPTAIMERLLEAPEQNIILEDRDVPKT